MALTPIPISIPAGYNYGAGIMPPAQAGIAPSAAKEPEMKASVNALEILGLINVGKNVLNVSPFLEEHPILRNNPEILTSIIKNERKKGSDVEFGDDGRIKITEELFKDIVASAETTASARHNPQTIKLSVQKHPSSRDNS